ncbi:hypothetical protein JKP88DRAFT_334681 [Tribonema minus]|uniref:C2 domain-containing protein n=1 Tax=Tribonema minus TaxID=303371 RepID=A0A835YTA2_9STRA|nr:hypothetical protein JKP88DRAFT_334681 [Tribonema minus]
MSMTAAVARSQQLHGPSASAAVSVAAQGGGGDGALLARLLHRGERLRRELMQATATTAAEAGANLTDLSADPTATLAAIGLEEDFPLHLAAANFARRGLQAGAIPREGGPANEEALSDESSDAGHSVGLGGGDSGGFHSAYRLEDEERAVDLLLAMAGPPPSTLAFPSLSMLERARLDALQRVRFVRVRLHRLVMFGSMTAAPEGHGWQLRYRLPPGAMPVVSVTDGDAAAAAPLQQQQPQPGRQQRGALISLPVPARRAHAHGSGGSGAAAAGSRPGGRVGRGKERRQAPQPMLRVRRSYGAADLTIGETTLYEETVCAIELDDATCCRWMDATLDVLLVDGAHKGLPPPPHARGAAQQQAAPPPQQQPLAASQDRVVGLARVPLRNLLLSPELRVAASADIIEVIDFWGEGGGGAGGRGRRAQQPPLHNPYRGKGLEDTDLMLGKRAVGALAATLELLPGEAQPDAQQLRVLGSTSSGGGGGGGGAEAFAAATAGAAGRREGRAAAAVAEHTGDGAAVGDGGGSRLGARMVEVNEAVSTVPVAERSPARPRHQQPPRPASPPRRPSPPLQLPPPPPQQQQQPRPAAAAAAGAQQSEHTQSARAAPAAAPPSPSPQQPVAQSAVLLVRLEGVRGLMLGNLLLAGGAGGHPLLPPSLKAALAQASAPRLRSLRISYTVGDGAALKRHSALGTPLLPSAGTVTSGGGGGSSGGAGGSWRLGHETATEVVADGAARAAWRQKSLIMEVWVEVEAGSSRGGGGSGAWRSGGAGEFLIGLAKVSLAPLSGGVEPTSTLPLVAVDGAVPISDPFGGAVVGRLVVLVALGTERQIASAISAPARAAQFAAADRQQPQPDGNGESVPQATEALPPAGSPVRSARASPPPSSPARVTGGSSPAAAASIPTDVTQASAVSETSAVPAAASPTAAAASAADAVADTAAVDASLFNGLVLAAALRSCSTAQRGREPPSHDLVSHTLELCVRGEMPLPQSAFDAEPDAAALGCSVTYRLACAATDAVEAAAAPRSGGGGSSLWWDADSSILNSRTRHVLRVASSGGSGDAGGSSEERRALLDSVCGGCAAGLAMELWWAGGSGSSGDAQLLGSALLPRSALETLVSSREGSSEVTLPVTAAAGAPLSAVPSALPLLLSHRREPVAVTRRKAHALLQQAAAGVQDSAAAAATAASAGAADAAAADAAAPPSSAVCIAVSSIEGLMESSGPMAWVGVQFVDDGAGNDSAAASASFFSPAVAVGAGGRAALAWVAELPAAVSAAIAQRARDFGVALTAFHGESDEGGVHRAGAAAGAVTIGLGDLRLSSGTVSGTYTLAPGGAKATLAVYRKQRGAAAAAAAAARAVPADAAGDAVAREEEPAWSVPPPAAARAAAAGAALLDEWRVPPPPLPDLSTTLAADVAQPPAAPWPQQQQQQCSTPPADAAAAASAALQVTIERALRLPAAADGAPPTTYVTCDWEIDGGPPQLGALPPPVRGAPIVTGVVRRCASPAYAHAAALRVPDAERDWPRLCAPAAALVFRVWRRGCAHRLGAGGSGDGTGGGDGSSNGGSGAVGPPPSPRSRLGDALIGAAVVSLAALRRRASAGGGLAEIDGWYHVLDELQRPQGQLKVRVAPQFEHTAGGAPVVDSHAGGVSQLAAPSAGAAEGEGGCWEGGDAYNLSAAASDGVAAAVSSISSVRIPTSPLSYESEQRSGGAAASSQQPDVEAAAAEGLSLEQMRRLLQDLDQVNTRLLSFGHEPAPADAIPQPQRAARLAAAAGGGAALSTAAAIVTIQSHVRGMLGRRRAQERRRFTERAAAAAALAAAAAAIIAARRLQRWWRGRLRVRRIRSELARRRAQRAQAQREAAARHEFMARASAAAQLQRWWRRRRRRRVQAAVAERQQRNRRAAAAVTVQRAVRGLLARRRAARLRLAARAEAQGAKLLEQRRQQDAAVAVQAAAAAAGDSAASESSGATASTMQERPSASAAVGGSGGAQRVRFAASPPAASAVNEPTAARDTPQHSSPGTGGLQHATPAEPLQPAPHIDTVATRQFQLEPGSGGSSGSPTAPSSDRRYGIDLHVTISGVASVKYDHASAVTAAVTEAGDAAAAAAAPTPVMQQRVPSAEPHVLQPAAAAAAAAVSPLQQQQERPPRDVPASCPQHDRTTVSAAVGLGSDTQTAAGVQSTHRPLAAPYSWPAQPLGRSSSAAAAAAAANSGSGKASESILRARRFADSETARIARIMQGSLNYFKADSDDSF